MAEDDNHIDVTTSEMGSESNQAVASENDYIWQSDDESEGCDDDPTDDYNPESEDGGKKDKKKPKRAASKRKPKNSSADSNTAKRPKRNANKKDNLNDSFDEFEDESQKKTKNKKTQKPKKSVKISPHGSSSLSNEEDDNGPNNNMSDSSFYNFIAKNNSGGFFNPGEVLWKIGLKDTLKGHFSERSLKKEDLECQVPSTKITIDVVVAVEKTTHPLKAKKFLTKCTPIGMDKPSILKTEILYKFGFDDDENLRIIHDLHKRYYLYIDDSQFKDLKEKVVKANRILGEIKQEERMMYFKGEVELEPEPSQDDSVIIEEEKINQGSDNGATNTVTSKTDDNSNISNPVTAKSNDGKEKVRPPKKSSNLTDSTDDVQKVLKEVSDEAALAWLHEKKFKNDLSKIFRGKSSKEQQLRHNYLITKNDFSIRSFAVQNGGVDFFKNENGIEQQFLKAGALVYDKLFEEYDSEEVKKKHCDRFKSDYVKYVIIPEGIVHYMKLQFKLSYKKANDIFVNHTTYEYDEYKEDDLETEKFSKRPLFKEVPKVPQEEDLSLSKYEDDDIPDFDTL